jgi:hypothetical protein
MSDKKADLMMVGVRDKRCRKDLERDLRQKEHFCSGIIPTPRIHSQKQGGEDDNKVQFNPRSLLLDVDGVQGMRSSEHRNFQVPLRVCLYIFQKKVQVFGGFGQLLVEVIVVDQRAEGTVPLVHLVDHL